MEITVKNLKINYTESGSGDDVLLLHGWGSSNVVYKSIMAAMPNLHFIAPDLPGCGGSETMAEPYTIKDYADLVAELIEKLNLKNPILAGHSHGGRIILYMAVNGMVNPPKIILLDAAGLIPKKTAKQKFRAKSFKIIKAILSFPLWKRSAEPLLNKARRHYGSADYNAAKPVLRKTLVNVVNIDLRDELHKITCPTLLIWGENDTATPLADAKIIESRIKDSGLCVIKGTGHFSFCEKPYEANAIIKSFLGQE